MKHQFTTSTNHKRHGLE